MKMQKNKLHAALTALAVTAASLSAVTGIHAAAADGAGGYSWEKTDGYQEATVSVQDGSGKTTVTFDKADNKEYIAGFCAQDGSGWDWSDYTKLSMTVTNTGSSAVTFGIALGTGGDWNWHQSNTYATIDPGASQDLSYYLTGEEWTFNDTVCAVADLYEVHRINMMISAPTDTPVSGSVEISDLKLGGSASATVEPKDGFYVNGSKLCDANGNPFIMRGTNYAYTWFKWQNNVDATLKEIANYGANTVRIVLGDGDQYDKNTAGEISNLIKICEANKLIAVFEVHDATGKNDAQPLLNAAKYFAELKSALAGHEDTVIINIANEWQGSANDSAWQSAYIDAVKIIRDAGLKHCIMCDAGGWGQTASTVINGGAAVLEKDPEHNTMFSVHMYGYAGGTQQMIKNIMDSMITRQLCLVIGEFGYKHSDGDVDEAYIMEYAQQTGTGWMAWSWNGNGSPVEYLDMSSANAGGTLSKDWGEVVVNGANGWKETAKVCSVFTGEKPAVTTTAVPATTTTTETTTAIITTVTTEPAVIETTTTETPILTTTTTEPEAVKPSMLGDVDENGIVDVSDAVLLARYNAEDDTAVISGVGKANADTDRNGKLEADDIVVILKFVAKLIPQI